MVSPVLNMTFPLKEKTSPYEVVWEISVPPVAVPPVTVRLPVVVLKL